MTDQEKERGERLIALGYPITLNGVPCICAYCVDARAYQAEHPECPKPVPPEAYRGTRSGALKL